MSAFLRADWPAPPRVHALTTLRHGLGVSMPPFDSFNLGARCGDMPEAVEENRRQLAAALALPSAPRWLRQVHGIDVAVEPNAEEYLPGKPAKVRLKLTGPDGRPIIGSTVLTAYDKSVEYIAGGTNVPEIRAAFWSWKIPD